jgi:chemotaxis protein MotA
MPTRFNLTRVLKQPGFSPLVTVVTTAVAIIAAVALLWPQFIDAGSLLITLGGAVAATCVSYPKSQLREMIATVAALFSSEDPPIEDHVRELSRLARLHQLHGLKALESQESHIKDAFLRHAIGMLVDLDRRDRICARLEYLLGAASVRHQQSRQILLTLGKLLPSFGLIGTLIGMVLLLRNIAGQDSHALPAALGLAVLTTLYGALFANALVAPLATRVHAAGVEKEIRMRLTMDWAMMILAGEAAATIARRLQSLVPASSISNPSQELTPAVLPFRR